MKTALAVAAALALWAGAPAHAQDRVDQRRAAGATGSVEVTLGAGSVTVIGWSRNEVRVTGTLGRSGESVEFDETGDRLVVRVVPRRGGQASANLEVRIPARRSATVRTVSASASVEDVDGLVDVRTVSGRARVSGSPREVTASSRSGGIEVDANTARVNATTVSGGVRVSGAARELVEASSVSGSLDLRAATREVRANSVSGTVRARGVTGRTTATTVSGNVHVEGSRVAGTFRSVSGSVRVDGGLDPSGGLSFTTHSGDVELVLARGAALEVDFSTFSGHLTSSFAAVMGGTDRQRRISVGRGGPTVSIRTFSGDAKLLQR
jgi:DUF4097 and DUF4098 domain-containing protein YvlB